MNSLEGRNEQSRVAKSTDSSGECYSLKWRMSQEANVTFSSGECNSLEWEMYPLGNKMNSLEWQNEQSLVVKWTVSSGEMNSLG